MANSETVHVLINNTTPNPINWNISDGTKIVASGSLDGNQSNSGSEAAVTPGTLTGGAGQVPNGLIVTVAPK